MVNVPKHLLVTGSFFEEGYQPLMDFDGWRVAVLRYMDAVDPAHFHGVERHRNTNEVFILTAGQADLILADGDGHPTDTYVFPMQLNVAYNIQRAVWHHVVMSPDAHIILFERSETGPATTDYADLRPETLRATVERFTLSPA